MTERGVVVTPWHHQEQRRKFCSEWGINAEAPPEYLVLQHDAEGEGCGVTKNKGVKEALRRGAGVVVILDDDCFPSQQEGPETLLELIRDHFKALEPQPVKMFETVTTPPSRGTPYDELSMTFPVAASMGFWTEIGDFDAVRQLAHFPAPMTACNTGSIFGRYFPLCGMNLAYRPKDWLPWCRFVDVPRFDDIWMGWLWQRHAYEQKHCFNLGGPIVRHSRQSNVWSNLRAEAEHLEVNETLWRKIATHEPSGFEDLARLLPVDHRE